MRYMVIFLLLAVGLTVLAVQRGGWVYLLLWPAASAAVVAAGYAGLGARVFGKRRDGGVAPWALALHLPYLLITLVVWQVIRLTIPERAADQVAPGIWVGRRPYDAEIPPSARWVIDVTAEFWPARRVRTGRGYACHPTLDAHVSDDRAFAAAVRDVTALDGDVLIHCAQGHGRSAALAAAVLIARGVAADVDEAERLLTAARAGTRLKPAQRALVRRLTEDLRQRPAAAQPA
jgi:cytochrome c553